MERCAPSDVINEADWAWTDAESWIEFLKSYGYVGEKMLGWLRANLVDSASIRALKGKH